MPDKDTVFVDTADVAWVDTADVAWVKEGTSITIVADRRVLVLDNERRILRVDSD